MTDARIIFKNYWRLGTILAKSSEHPQYPATDTQVDTLVQFWRSRHGPLSGNGAFVVSATNNDIDFDEGGAEFTATLTPGTYDGNALAVEIKTKMDAAGGTYTVTYSESTAKFTIARGAGNFTLRWQSGTNVAHTSGTMLGFIVSADDTGAATYTSDYRRIHYPSDYLINDILAPQQINFVALLNHNFSPGAVITVYGATDAGMTTGVESVVVPYFASNIYHFLPTPITKRYWRIKVEDPTNSNSYVQIATPILAPYWQPSISYSIRYPDGYEDASPIDISDSGNEYGQPKPIYKVAEFPFIVADAEKGSIDSFLQWTGITNGFVMCLDYDNPNTQSFFMKNRDLVVPTFNSADFWEWTIRAKQVL